ncbi:MAG TPA: hypothetical protein DCF93_12560 [Desulfuromonas sp.]|nr:hypothetical protein [Desulfuromonas sp.]
MHRLTTVHGDDDAVGEPVGDEVHDPGDNQGEHGTAGPAEGPAGPDEDQGEDSEKEENAQAVHDSLTSRPRPQQANGIDESCELERPARKSGRLFIIITGPGKIKGA